MHIFVVCVIWQHIGFLAGLVFLKLHSQKKVAQKPVPVMARNPKMRLASEIPVIKAFVEPPKKRARPRISSCNLMADFGRLKTLQEKNLNDKARGTKMHLKPAMGKISVNDQQIFTSDKGFGFNTYCNPKGPLRLSPPVNKKPITVIPNVFINHRQTFTAKKVGDFTSRCAMKTPVTISAPIKKVRWSNPVATRVC